jgi:replicative DNA helicase
VADRADQTPALSDLRDSGGIEQDADVVAFINRPIVAKPDLPADFKHYALLRVAKNRQGQQGDVHLHYQGELTKFAAWGGEPPSLKLATAPAMRHSLKGEI